MSRSTFGQSAPRPNLEQLPRGSEIGGGVGATVLEPQRTVQEPLCIAPAKLLDIVHLLYASRVTPKVALVQWHLQAVLHVKVLATDIRQAVAELPDLYIAPHTRGAGTPNRRGYRQGLFFVILLTTAPPDFQSFLDDPAVGAASTEMKDWPPDFIIEVAQHLLIGGWPRADDPRHDKYEITEWLRERCDVLWGLPWGQCLRVVLWFLVKIGHGGGVQVLGKRENRVVPYPASEDYDKQENARLRRPTGLRPGEAYVSTWPELRECLTTLVMAGGGWARSSDMKKAFREHFERELTETAFGHTSLINLLQDPECACAFEVRETNPTDSIWFRLAKEQQIDESSAGGKRIMPRMEEKDLRVQLGLNGGLSAGVHLWQGFPE